MVSLHDGDAAVDRYGYGSDYDVYQDVVDCTESIGFRVLVRGAGRNEFIQPVSPKRLDAPEKRLRGLPLQEAASRLWGPQGGQTSGTQRA